MRMMMVPEMERVIESDVAASNGRSEALLIIRDV
jgi:hypothetical protein